MLELLRVLLVSILCLAAILTPIIIVADIGSRYACNNYEKTTGKETRYLLLDSCYVKTDTGWQRWDEYKNRASASEGLNN